MIKALVKYTTNPTERHRACSPSKPAERSASAHRAVSTERSPSIPPSNFCRALAEHPPSNFWAYPSARRAFHRAMLGGNCSVGARRALGRIARRACSVALGGISGVGNHFLYQVRGQISTGRSVSQGEDKIKCISIVFMFCQI